MENKSKISDELLNRYILGKASLEEIAYITMAMKKDDDFSGLISLMENLNKSGLLYEEQDIPMASMAAVSENNLCDVFCEQYILKDYADDNFSKNIEHYTNEAIDNCWLKESGTPLHNIGRLLEKRGMSISRKYHCNLEELETNLKNKYKIIAIVDYGQLWNKLSDGVFHAVVCLNVNNDIITIYDPAIDGTSSYTTDDFVKAWNYSKNYLVCASAEGLEYKPHPINVEDVELDNDLMELCEAISENAHEIWAERRHSEGWRYGKYRDDNKKETPDMIPYSELSENEKEYDRVMAFNTIRLVKKLGYNISRKFTIYCEKCGEFVGEYMNFCPNCGNKLPLDK